MSQVDTMQQQVTKKEMSVVAKDPGRFRQNLAAFIVNISTLSYGIMVGWTSPMLPILQSSDSPVGEIAMSDETASWMTSILCLGGLLAVPVVGTLTEKCGRKITGCLISMIHGISFLLLILATSHIHLLIGRFIGGIGGSGSVLLSSLYVSETASDQRRGYLGSFLVLFINFGILTSYVTGSILSYRICNICYILLPLFYLGCFIFLPETPIYLVRRNKISQAVKSLMWLKANDENAVTIELARLRSRVQMKEINCDMEMDKETEPAMGMEMEMLTKSTEFCSLIRDRGTIKGLIISVGLMSGQQLCGIFAVIGYGATIFQMAGSSLSANTAAIIVAIIQIIGSFVSTTLMEHAGRKSLILISCGTMCLCHCVLGAFCYLQSLATTDIEALNFLSFGWIPVTALSCFVFAFCLGMGPAPYVVTSELFSPEISGTCTSISVLSMWLLALVVAKFFPNFNHLFGIHASFFLLAVFCASTFIFTLVLVPETKGRDIQSIVDELRMSPVKTLANDLSK